MSMEEVALELAKISINQKSYHLTDNELINIYLYILKNLKKEENND